MTRLRVPHLEKIWRTEGSLSIDDPLTPEEAFARLDPLFQTDGTHYAIEGDMLGYHKTNPRAQDKLATFTSGTLRVEQVAGTTRLTFQAASTALLLCFLAPLLFLSFAQVAEEINAYERAKAEASTKKDKKDEAEEKKKPQLHWIDQMLGAPEPKDPNADKDKKKEPKEKIRTTPAYVLAGLFFAIYLVGRFLEPWLFKRTLRQALARTSGEPRSAGSTFSSVEGAGLDPPRSALAPHG
jgi:hypothetical protein